MVLGQVLGQPCAAAVQEGRQPAGKTRNTRDTLEMATAGREERERNGGKESRSYVRSYAEV